MEKYDYIIVGGGIAGASAGFQLAARGAVLLVEREGQFGYHTTGRSAALYTKSHGPAVVRAITSASKQFLLHPPEGFAEYELLRPRGMLTIGRVGQDAALESFARESEEFVPDTRRLDAREACAMLPVLREEYVGGGVLDPEAMDMDVHALHWGYLRGMRAQGGKSLTDAELLELRRDDGWAVVTSAGSFNARVVINAAGAWGDVVATIAGAKPVGLVPRRRTAFVFEPPSGLEIHGWPMLHDLDETFYFKPDAGKLLASPADETPMPPCDVHPDDLDVAIAVDRIQKAARLPVAHIDRRWSGLRTFAPDRCPVVGFDPQVEGFFWLCGQGGYGIETSAAMGRLCAGLAGEGRVPADLAGLGVTAEAVSPARFRQP